MIYELDLESDGLEVQEYLYEFTKQKTVPNVFVRKNHVGGCDDTMKAFGEGRLQALLAASEANPTDQKLNELISNNEVVIFSFSTSPDNVVVIIISEQKNLLTR